MLALRTLNRWQAAGIHFGLSVAIAATVLSALLLVWYPQPYFRLAGGAGLMMILIGVDVVLGPLMTLVVFNPAKKSLRFDLAVIAAVQVAALAYGIMVIAEARPAYVVYAGERFNVVGANAISPESLAQARPPFNELPIDGPKIVGAKMPTDQAEREKVMMLLTSGFDLPSLPRYYVTFPEIIDTLKQQAKPIDELVRRKPGVKAEIDAAVAKSGVPGERLRWVPVLGRLEAGVALVDTTGGSVVAVVPVDPF